jgi:hypothetical protein
MKLGKFVLPAALVAASIIGTGTKQVQSQTRKDLTENTDKLPFARAHIAFLWLVDADYPYIWDEDIEKWYTGKGQYQSINQGNVEEKINDPKAKEGYWQFRGERKDGKKDGIGILAQKGYKIIGYFNNWILSDDQPAFIEKFNIQNPEKTERLIFKEDGSTAPLDEANRKILEWLQATIYPRKNSRLD